MINTYRFRGQVVRLFEVPGQGFNTSLSSIALSEVLPKRFDRLRVLDVGCGSGFMTIGPLKCGASSAVSLDIADVRPQLKKSFLLNGLGQKRLHFVHSDILDQVDLAPYSFDAVIANVPQHALPGGRNVRGLIGKYGGFDGTDIICRAIVDAHRYLKRGGCYYGAVSELTNFHRTLGIARSLYRTKTVHSMTKELRPNEMSPYLRKQEVLTHLQRLRRNGLITYRGDGRRSRITYRVHLMKLTAT